MDANWSAISTGLVITVAVLTGCADTLSGDTDGETDTDTDAMQTDGFGTDAAPPPDEDEETDDDSDDDSDDDDDDAASESEPGTTEEPDSTTGGEPETTTDPTGDETGEEEEECVIGSTLASEVVMIGDSYLALTTVPTYLWDHARAAGSLAAMETYRPYQFSGTQMSNGQIPMQFDIAINEDPNISTVIMTGGGNDVLIGSAAICLSQPPPAEPCVAAIDSVLTTAATLMDDMAEAGVKDVVYFFYPHLPPGFPFGAKNETLDYAAPLVQALCEEHQGLDCQFVDIRPAFEGHPEYIRLDAIHPTDAGAAVIADLLWERMVEHCIAP